MPFCIFRLNNDEKHYTRLILTLYSYSHSYPSFLIKQRFSNRFEKVFHNCRLSLLASYEERREFRLIILINCGSLASPYTQLTLTTPAMLTTLTIFKKYILHNPTHNHSQTQYKAHTFALNERSAFACRSTSTDFSFPSSHARYNGVFSLWVFNHRKKYKKRRRK